MLFYDYCPECGTECGPYRDEPEENTPITCPYCGLEFGYHTRHWMAQLVLLRLVEIGVIIYLIWHGLFGGPKKKVEDVRDIRLDVEQVEITKGIGPGFEWGDEWCMGTGARDLHVRGTDSIITRVQLAYGENGLETILLAGYGVKTEALLAEIKREGIVGKLIHAVKRSGMTGYQKDNRYALVGQVKDCEVFIHYDYFDKANDTRDVAILIHNKSKAGYSKLDKIIREEGGWVKM